jgi:uncharacterized protein
VIFVDVNLLLYAVDERSERNRAAHRWLESVLSGDETIGLPWMVLLAFLRLSTKPGLFPRPLSNAQAFDLVEEWLAMPLVSVPQPGPGHAGHLRALLLHAGTGGDLTSDAHLAALAIEYVAEICTADRDFSRFAGVRWRNPLTGARGR